MNINDDLKSAGIRLAEDKIEKLLGGVKFDIEAATSPANLVEILEQKCPNAKIQFIVAQAIIFLAERDGGKYRGGTPTLADQILDQQAIKVKRYGEKSYRLSEKQIGVIARDAWAFLRPEMVQGNF